MYRSIYLLQKRWRLNHNGSIMVAYDIIMACYPVHRPQRREWGIWSISGATWERSGYIVMLQLVNWYLRMFFNILQCHMTMIQSQMLWKASMGSHDETHDCKSMRKNRKL